MMIYLLSSFTIFFFIATEIPTLSSATSNETDLQALLDFKNRIQTHPFQVLNYWNDSVHFCDWQGITCGKMNKRVTVLNVSSLDLVGTLSPSVGNLSFLEEIYLDKNSFYGMIPSEIGRLFHLRYLEFGNNSFDQQIPANITLCKNLRTFDLSRNKLSGRIPDELGALPNLKALVLYDNNFTGNIPPSLEYGMGGDVSAKGDIYSYGILLLEMFTGKRPTDTMFTEDFSLHNYVKNALHDRVAEIIDPKLLTVEDNEEKGSNYTSTRIESCCLSIFRVGVSCSSEMHKNRMDINDALIELQHVRNEL